MKAKRLTCATLAFANVRRKPMRTVGLAIIVAVFAFALFCGSMLTQSLKSGIESMSGRIGADLMVVPRGSEADLQNSLLRSEPSTFYLEDDIIDGLSSIGGVAQTSPQLFIASLNAACCTVPVQLIGYDPDTDFTITPWMTNTMSEPLSSGQVVVGSLILAEPGDEVFFYGQPFQVVAKLAETGMGFDSSIFMTTDTAQHMIDLSGEKAVHPAGSGEGLVSSILIRLDADADATQVADEIIDRFPHTDVVISDDFMRNIAGELLNTSGLTLAITILLWVVAVLVLLFVFSITFNERKKEFALLGALGATRSKIVGVILCESLITTAIGTACGLLAACLILFPFQTLIATSMGLPYLTPSAGSVLVNLLVSAGISVLIGPLSCLYSAVRLSKTDTYFTIRENE